MTKETGGPAFPQSVLDNHQYKIYDGMTLRDWFAGQQLIAYRAHPANEPIANLNFIADYCYAMADAMLKARSND
jgi:hypothetical protein